MTFKAKVNQGNMIMISSYNLTADFSIIKECMIMFHHYNLVIYKLVFSGMFNKTPSTNIVFGRFKVFTNITSASFLPLYITDFISPNG